MPGPLLALTFKESLSRGKWAALWLSSGHSLCELVMVGALVAGLARFVSIDYFVGPVGLVGGAILLWMGIGAFRQTALSGTLAEHSGSSSKTHNVLIGGAVVTIANPYWIVWWLTAGLALVLIATKVGITGIITFYIGHISADFLWFGIVGFLVGWRGQTLSDKVYRRILQGCGAFLFVFGVLFVGFGGKLIHSTLIR